MNPTTIKTVLALTLAHTALAGGAGCTDDETPLGFDESEIFVASGIQLWHGAGGRGNRDVPLCWETPTGTMPWNGFGADQAMAMAYLKRSWQAASGIRFVDRGACPTTGTEQMIRLRHIGFATTDAGAQSGGQAYEGVGGLRPPAVGPSTWSLHADLPVKWNSTTQRYEKIGSEDRQRYVYGHEMGHVLGYAHEQDHTLDQHAVDCRGGGAAATGGTSVTAYDRDSIMNYCQAGGNWTGALTSIDIQGTRELYGWRDATDYDNDGRSNLGVWRPSTGRWYVEDGAWDLHYGEAGDVPLTADFDNDGASDYAVWRPSGPYQGTWFVIKSSGGYMQFQWGANGDLPTTGDLDGDGKAEFIVYRPSNATFYVRNLDGSGWSMGPWGAAGDIPVLADYDGDGKTDLALYRPSGPYAGSWFIAHSTTPGWYQHTYHGTTGDIPVVGDFDGDHKSDRAVFRPSNGTWYVASSGGGSIIRQFGAAGDIPLSLDIDGDAITELSVWRPSQGWFYVARASDGAWLDVVNLGTNGDIPLGRTIR